MTDAAQIEGTAEDVTPAEDVAAMVPVGPSTLAVTPQAGAGELVARMSVISEAMADAMDEGTDYGVIPGTDKPALLKPGAEKLGVLFQLDIQLANEKIWNGDHLTVMSRATVFHAPSGARLGFGEGICSTREKKYAKRKAQRVCPECGTPAIFRSKFPPRDNPDAPPGFYCYGKRGGCGADFAADDSRITSQTEGSVENPDLPDSWNTVVKMAEKRARVDAVLAVTGASALFTQDVDEQAKPEPEPPPAPEPAPPIAPDSLLEAAQASGVENRAIWNFATRRGVDAPEPETDEEARRLLDRLAPGARRQFLATCDAFRAEREAQARETAQAREAEAAAS